MPVEQATTEGANTSAMADREIVITRVFDAPRDLVFQAWTDPEHIDKWWGPEGFRNETFAMDVRPGGVWRYVMHGPDGTDYPNRTVFVEVMRPERLVYDHGWDADDFKPDFRTAVTFTDEGGKTRLTMRMLFPSAEARDYVVKEFGAVEGGNQTLTRLGEYLAEQVAGAGESDSVVVRVSRSFDAPAERVFDAWIDPASVGQWMFGPTLRDEEVLHLETDPRVGGRFSFLVRRQGNEIDHVGTYREVDRPCRLGFTWGVVGESDDESVVTIEIRPVNGGCDLTLTHEMDPRWADYATRTEAGWTTMLDAMAAHFASTSNA